MNTMEVAIDHKQSLNDMLVTKNVLLDTIYSNEGVIDEEQIHSLEKIENDLLVKVDGWGWTLAKNGAIDKEIELWQQRKEAVDCMIKALHEGKERLKSYAHHVMLMNHVERIDGSQFWIKRDFSKCKSVMLEVVEAEYKKYILPVLNYKQYGLLMKILALNNEKLDDHSEFEEIYSSNELLEKLRLETTERCNVSDLPEGHNAIVIEEKPTVRVFAKR